MRAASVVLLLLLAACAATKKEPPPRPFAGTLWQLQLELPLPGEAPHVRFGDGRMEGFGGCSRIAARYVQDTVGARAIVIGRMEVDRRVCEARVVAVERGVLETLQAVSSYVIIGDTMTMTGSGGSLRFRAAPQPDAPKESRP